MSKAEEGMAAEDWAGESGRNWLANLQRFEGMIQPIGAALLTHAAFRPGETVIDIGCGGGGTTIAIARAVSPGGHATGLDISQELIWSAATRASTGTQSSVSFVCADAATASVTGAPFDRLFSRFGSMFFPDAHAGFRNLRTMLRTGGRMDLAVWAPPQENGWISLIREAMQPHISQPPGDPRAPGPFALSDTGYIHELLGQADFGDIAITGCERALPLGGPGATPEEGADFIASTLSVGKALDAAPADVRARAIADIAEALRPHQVPGKGNLLPGKAWLVTALAV